MHLVDSVSQSAQCTCYDEQQLILDMYPVVEVAAIKARRFCCVARLQLHSHVVALLGAVDSLWGCKMTIKATGESLVASDLHSISAAWYVAMCTLQRTLWLSSIDAMRPRSTKPWLGTVIGVPTCMRRRE